MIEAAAKMAAKVQDGIRERAVAPGSRLQQGAPTPPPHHIQQRPGSRPLVTQHRPENVRPAPGECEQGLGMQEPFVPLLRQEPREEPGRIIAVRAAPQKMCQVLLPAGPAG